MILILKSTKNKWTYFLLDKKEPSNQKLNIEIKLKPKRTERLQTYITSQLKKEIEVSN